MLPIDYGRANLVIQMGTDWSRVFQWLLADGVTPVNLTGYHAKMKVRATPQSAAAIVSVDDVGGGIVIDAANGRITVTLAHAVLVNTLDLSSITTPSDWRYETLDDTTQLRGFGKVGVYDIELTDASGNVTRLLQGDVVFDAEVSHG